MLTEGLQWMSVTYCSCSAAAVFVLIFGGQVECNATKQELMTTQLTSTFFSLADRMHIYDLQQATTIYLEAPSCGLWLMVIARKRQVGSKLISRLRELEGWIHAT